MADTRLPSIEAEDPLKSSRNSRFPFSGVIVPASLVAVISRIGRRISLTVLNLPIEVNLWKNQFCTKNVSLAAGGNEAGRTKH